MTLASKFIALFMLLSCACSPPGTTSGSTPGAGDLIVTSRFDVPPFVINADNVYYAYVMDRNREGVAVYSSTDLASWAEAGIAFSPGKDIPWNTDGVRGINPDVTVLANGGKFYLYFTSMHEVGDQIQASIGVAVSDKPQGPFRDPNGKPVYQFEPSDNLVSTPFPFRDDDGRIYLYFTRSNGFYAAPLNPSQNSLAGPVLALASHWSSIPIAFSVIKQDHNYLFIWPKMTSGQDGPTATIFYQSRNSPTERLDLTEQKVLVSGIIIPTSHPPIISYRGFRYLAYQSIQQGNSAPVVKQTNFHRLTFQRNGTIAPMISPGTRDTTLSPRVR